MKKRITPIFLLVLFFTLGFKLPPHKGPEDFDRETIKYFKQMNEGGIITAFLGDPSLRSTLLQASYWIAAKGEFSGKYFIGNYNDKPEEFTLFCLLDYQQVEFTFKNKKGLTHQFRLKKGEELEVPIKLGRMAKGAHDLILVAANISHDEPILSYVQCHRANVFAGATDFPGLKPADGSGRKVETDNNTFKIAIEKEPDSPKNRLSVKTNNSLEENITSMLLFFHNFKQVSHEPLFFKLNSKHEIKASVEIAPVKTAENTIFCLKINNPFTVMEPKPNVLASIDTAVDLSNVIFPKKTEIKK